MKLSKQALDHLKSHVEFPISKASLIATCDNWSDATEADRKIASTLPNKTFNSADDVLKALRM